MLPHRDSPMASAPRAPLSAPARAVYKALLKAATPPPSLSRAAETHVSAAASLTPQPSPRGPQRAAGVGRHGRDPVGVLPWARGGCSALDSAGASSSEPTPARRAATRFEEDWARRQPSDWDALCHEERRLVQLQVALEMESEQHGNYLGSQLRVAQFVASSLLDLTHANPRWLPPDCALGALAWGFMNYDAKGGDERAALVVKALTLLARLRVACHAAHLAALPGAGPGAGAVLTLQTGGQRSPAWHAAREGLLTASQFGSVLGLHGAAKLQEAWEQRVKLRAPFAGNAATQWGVSSEPLGVAAYERLTGAVLEHPDLGCVRDAPGDNPWLGASPDGLLVGQPGVVEIKCPVRRPDAGGGPATAKPYPHLPPYYVPQLLGVQRVFQRDFGDLFCYTQQHGCVSWRVPHSRDTWQGMEEQLRSFWKQNVLPARAALKAGVSEAEVRQLYQPVANPEAAAWAQEQCERISREADVTQFPSPPLEELQRRAAGVGAD